MIFLEVNRGWFVPLNDQLYFEQRISRDPQSVELWDVYLGHQDDEGRTLLYSSLSLSLARKILDYIKAWMIDYQANERPLYVIPKPEWLKER